MKVVAEALVGLLEQFGGCVQVDLSGGDVDVTEVGGERGQQRIDIFALAVPRQHPSAGEGVAFIPRPE